MWWDGEEVGFVVELDFIEVVVVGDVGDYVFEGGVLEFWVECVVDLVGCEEDVVFMIDVDGVG